MEQAGQAKPNSHHHESEAQCDAQYVRDRAAEAEIGGRRRDHDDVRPRRQAHDRSERHQWSQQLAHAA
jgi:hypothetical protein